MGKSDRLKIVHSHNANYCPKVTKFRTASIRQDNSNVIRHFPNTVTDHSPYNCLQDAASVSREVYLLLSYPVHLLWGIA